VARVYEGALAKAGLTSTQFAVLRALERKGGTLPLTHLAEELVLERTSLYRAIAPLERDALVKVTATKDRRAKALRLTPACRKRIAAALPHWTKAHAAFVGGYGKGKWMIAADSLNAAIKVAQGMA
jgi:DNA-binding MarR family transcriptional regulator